MSYKVLARKWRPKLFNEVIGQDHITRTLKNSITSEKVAHAYLLTGTRGIGKTSIARIFAKSLRCENRTVEGEPCLKCHSCEEIENTHSIDYLEIDGASNNSVENIRDLVETIQYLPSTGKYKVYVIDEVHMLTVSAFNALLKTLEEPPSHVIFIFATTDPQKLLGTVLSRCQRFDFKNSTIDDLTKHILTIAKNENIKFTEDKLAQEIAKQAKGSVRDALSLFDQVIALSNSDTITEDNLNLSLGMVQGQAIQNLLSCIFHSDKKGLLTQYNSLVADNLSLPIFSHQLLNAIYELVIQIDASGNLPVESIIPGMETISLVELMWIYENLSKDFEWSLGSLTPEHNICFSLIKMTVREKIISLDATPVAEKKNSLDHDVILEPEVQQTEAVEEAIVSEVAPENVPEVGSELLSTTKTWKDFIIYLYSKHKALAMNLERGNLHNESGINMSQSDFAVAFGQDCKIFYDYLNESDIKQNLKAILSVYLERRSDLININFQLLNDEEKKEVQFQSSLEIEEGLIKDKLQEQKNEIMNSNYIKEAESLFNSKISKIILNDEN